MFTPSGNAKIDESTLALPFPEAQKLARSFMLQKRLGMLAEGKNAWMQLVDTDGKLRHTINPLGTVTGRASSFGPNLQQVPAVRAAFGKECRALFTVPQDFHWSGLTWLASNYGVLVISCKTAASLLVRFAAVTSTQQT